MIFSTLVFPVCDNPSIKFTVPVSSIACMLTFSVSKPMAAFRSDKISLLNISPNITISGITLILSGFLAVLILSIVSTRLSTFLEYPTPSPPTARYICIRLVSSSFTKALPLTSGILYFDLPIRELTSLASTKNKAILVLKLFSVAYLKTPYLAALITR